MARQSVAKRQRRHREGNAARLRHTIAMLRQISERLDLIEAYGVRLDRELTTAAAERRQANAVNEQLLKRQAALEQALLAPTGDRQPPRHRRNGLER
jgi:hypothetical protein